MSVLNSVILSALQAIILFYNMKFFNDITYTKRDYISIIGIIVPSVVLFLFVDSPSIVLLFICSLVFMYFKKNL